jgi:hypothetical protein
MSVITSIASKSRRATAPVEADQYEGLWLNPGIFVGTPEDKKFIRFNRGVAISDLKVRKLYESMDPDFAAEQSLLNQRIERIQAKALTLAEGEMCVVNIPMVLYRRQEEADVAPTPKSDIKAIDDELFGN